MFEFDLEIKHSKPLPISSSVPDIFKNIDSDESLPYIDEMVEDSDFKVAEVKEVDNFQTFPTKRIKVSSKHRNKYRRELIARYSMLADVDKCKKMAYYNWIEQSVFNEDSGSGVEYLATFLGTAGHALVEHIHLTNNFKMGYDEKVEMVTTIALEEYEKGKDRLAKTINIENAEDNLLTRVLDIVALIDKYCAMPRNRDFYATNIEQNFTMVVDVKEFFKDSNRPVDLIYITGTIDQIGKYRSTGETATRDLKFRDNALRPSKFELQINKQLVLYSSAMKYGFPTCDACKPKYETNPVNMERIVVFDGQCENCRKLNGTEKWPDEHSQLRELIWMRDLETYKRAYKGKKKGDTRGPCLYTYENSSRFLDKYLYEMIDSFCNFMAGDNARNPGDHCNMWCNRKRECISELNEIDNVKLFNIEV